MVSLQWLSHCTGQDISTATALLSQYQNSPSPGHLRAKKRIVKYLKGTSTHGITFHSDHLVILHFFYIFHIGTHKNLQVSPMQTGGHKTNLLRLIRIELWPFINPDHSQGNIITLHGPIHWFSKRQSITARASAESEMYTTDEFCKDTIHLANHERPESTKCSPK